MKDYLLDWTPEKIAKFRKTLLDWYDATKRDLPWRHTIDPYKIWVSEIMSQQTQVGTVIPYYLRFIDALPTVASLANADEQLLLNLWQGLGYYSRVRNMQIAAKQIMEEYNGIMPNTMTELLKLKGIGPYTAAAIGSISYGLLEPAIDGNLLRVVARLFEIDADISLSSTRKIFADILYRLIDPERPGDFNQALMDLGATVMTPTNVKPDSHPLAEFDASYQKGTAHLYPVKTKKVKATHHTYIAYCVMDSTGAWLMRKHTENELLTGLWHYPMVEEEMVFESITASELLEPLQYWLVENLGQDVDLGDMRVIGYQAYQPYIPFMVKHIFSHRVWNVNVIPVRLNQSLSVNSPNYQWICPTQLNTIPISTLQQKLQQNMMEEKWH